MYCYSPSVYPMLYNLCRLALPTVIVSVIQVKAAILYIHPTSKAIALTQLTHLVTPDLAPRKQFGDLAIGDIIEMGEVVRVEKTRGVYFKLNDRVTGFAAVCTQLMQDLLFKLCDIFGLPKCTSLKPTLDFVSN